MDLLYAPWRSPYSESNDDAKKADAQPGQCVFCKQLAAHTDEEFLIIKRYKHCYVLLNKYPYNAGHLLILPLAHLKNLSELPTEARAEMMELITHATTIVETTLGCGGVNVGLNLGRAAGAGIPSHLHFHVLPRWLGDTNFTMALAGTRVISFDLDDVYKKLKPAFEKLKL